MRKIIVILIMLIVAACSTRKVNLEVSKDNSQIKIDSLVKEKTVQNIEIKIDKNITNWIETIEPIDTSNAIVIVDSFGKKTTLKNARIRREKIIDKTKIKAVLSEKKDHNYQKKSIKKKSVLNKTKQTKKTYSWTNIFWILIPMALCYGYKKYKEKIWFI